MRRPILLTSLCSTALVAVVVAGCGGEPTAEPTPRPGSASTSTGSGSSPSGSPSASADRRTGPPKVVGTVAEGLSVPWGIGFLPDGSALVTERDSGRVIRVDGGEVEVVGRIDQTSAAGEAGLLGLAVSPTYAQDRRIFVYATTRTDNRVLRVRYDGGRLSDPTPVLTGIPKGPIHDGGRLAFGPDGHLYVSTGETGQRELAQDEGSRAGKILRITQDGEPAPGNPDPRSPVWSIGHRNVQGLAFDDAGRLWASEFGQDTWDELNLIEKGVNYGWPQVEGRSEGRGGTSGLRDPQLVWRTSEASPSGLAFLDGHLWMASLRGQRLWRTDVDGKRAENPVAFFVGKYGRMRTVAVAPDGNLWVTTSNRDGRGDPRAADDRILLVSPGG